MLRFAFISLLISAFSYSSASAATADAFGESQLTLQHGYYAAALARARQLAGQSNANGEFMLGFMYDKGRGVPQNYSQAAQWYQKAAERGHAGAMNNLGVLSRHGRGCPRDLVEAMQWFLLADAAGNSNAAENLFELQLIVSERNMLRAQQKATDFVRRFLRPETQHPAAGLSKQKKNPLIYAVQIGVFAKEQSVKTIRKKLADSALRQHPVQSNWLKIKGKTLQRLRIGPYATREQAKEIQRYVENLFRLTTLIVPVLGNL